MQDRYVKQATTVVNNHRGKLASAGIADLGTLHYLYHRLPEGKLPELVGGRQPLLHARCTVLVCPAVGIRRSRAPILLARTVGIT